MKKQMNKRDLEVQVLSKYRNIATSKNLKNINAFTDIKENTLISELVSCSHEKHCQINLGYKRRQIMK